MLGIFQELYKLNFADFAHNCVPYVKQNVEIF